MKLAAEPGGQGGRRLQAAEGGRGSAAPRGAGGGGDDLYQAITVLRGRIDEEFRITERLDSKSRQAFALAAAIFAVVQTVAFGSFGEDTVGSGERIALLATALLAGLVLVVVAHRVRNIEDLLPEEDTKPGTIVEWCNEAPRDDPEYVPSRLVGELGRVADARAANNKRRAAKYEEVEAASRLALIAAALELVLAIAVRI